MKATDLIKALQEIGLALEKKATERADAERAAFNTSVDKMRDHLNDLTDELNSLARDAVGQNTMEELQRDVGRLEERVDELEGQDIEQMARRIDDLEDKVENQESEIERLGEELEGAERRIEDLEEKVSAMLRALTRYGSALNNLTDGE